MKIKMDFSSISTVLTIFLLTLCDGNSLCDFEPCLDTYNSLKSLYDQYRNADLIDIPASTKSTICQLQEELEDCTKKQSKNCRGDLNYHFFARLSQRLRSSNSRIIDRCLDTSPTFSSPPPTIFKVTEEAKLPHISPPHFTPREHVGRSGGRGHGGRKGTSARCREGIVSEGGSVGCALYGLTNLKGFSDPLNFTEEVPYCSLSGAWSLLDLDTMAVQITNKGGLSPLPKDITTTTLVTVIVKSNECSERKTYQATFDEVPAMFSDGTTTAGNVYIEELKSSEHVRIHFPYILTTIDIIKVVGHLPIPTLSVAIKMPESRAANYSSTLSRGSRGVPLCFYGCPRTASMKPRSVNSGQRCPQQQGAQDSYSPSSSEFLDTPNSITSAICDSLASMQSILSETTLLEQRVRLPEDPFVPESPSRHGHHLNSHHSSIITGSGTRSSFSNSSLLLIALILTSYLRILTLS